MTTFQQALTVPIRDAIIVTPRRMTLKTITFSLRDYVFVTPTYATFKLHKISGQLRNIPDAANATWRRRVFDDN